MFKIMLIGLACFISGCVTGAFLSKSSQAPFAVRTVQANSEKFKQIGEAVLAEKVGDEINGRSFPVSDELSALGVNNIYKMRDMVVFSFTTHVLDPNISIVFVPSSHMDWDYWIKERGSGLIECRKFGGYWYYIED